MKVQKDGLRLGNVSHLFVLINMGCLKLRNKG
jgi:hypothetical protein